MKIAHISDLHLGKIVNGFSMASEQEYILEKIVEILEENSIKTLLVCGDVFDKTVPSIEGLRLYDKFTGELYDMGIETYMISGNHDSLERLTCGSKLMRNSKMFIGRSLAENENKYTIEDEFGKINIYLLPFIKPANVRNAYEESVSEYSEAVEFAINKMNVNTESRNILLAHQFVTGATRSESEEIFVGGLDNVNAKVFDPFDYVALGHLHKSQYVQRETIRYCGTPLKYSISEKNDRKSLTVIDVREKGNITIDTLPLTPKHDIYEIKGKYDELMSLDYYSTIDRDGYFSIVLTDEEYIMDAVGRMRTVYKNIMSLSYENSRTRAENIIDKAVVTETKLPQDYIEELFEAQNGSEMSDYQKEIIENIIIELEGSR